MYTHNLIVNAIKGTFSNYTESVLFLLLWLKNQKLSKRQILRPLIN